MQIAFYQWSSIEARFTDRASFAVFLVWSPPHTGRQEHLLAGWAVWAAWYSHSKTISLRHVSYHVTEHSTILVIEIWGATSNLYVFYFAFPSSLRCCPLFLKRSVFFFFKALNISKVKSVDTSLESLLSLFSSQGILNLSAVDNRKPNSLLPVIPYLACGGQ